MNKSSIKQLMDEVVKFREERDWQQFIRLKDAAIAISLEAAEVLEHFKWKSDEEIKGYVVNHKKEIEEELMDVLFNVLLLAEEMGTDVDDMFIKKMEKNKIKYPIEKVKGKNPHL